MTEEQENNAFVKMLKEFPKIFGRVSFRERLMLRAAFDYVNEEVITDIKANCDLAIEGRDVKIMELEQQIEKMKCCENCKHKKSDVDRCELLMYTMNACLCKNKDKWEIKENGN